MRTLFAISDDLLLLDQMLSETGGEIAEDEAGQALERWFDQLGEERDRKLNGICWLIREFEARSEARELAAKALMASSGADLNSAKRLKSRVKLFLETHGLLKVQTEHFKLGIAQNGGIVPLIVPDAWKEDPANAPEAFQRRIIQLDNEAIREAIRNDEETRGAHLGDRGTHLRIR
ncbi:MAG: siphovirus Gp157 family protein [Blastocatellia bacterium]